ncbi:tubulin-specific chaperone e protein [Rutstroemia sp. NJR-2017a BBW]|nr:tubulin-specific chaperone e protein [Rutstroemia sp. NJR-2017a BBW]
MVQFSGNRLYVDSVELQVCQQQQAFSKVKSLELDEMLIDWVDLCRLLEGFPFITTLAASSNCFETLRWPLKHACLTSLTLEYNQFKTLADISSLSGLLSLESLLLKGNEISLIETTTSSGTGKKLAQDNGIQDTTPVFGPNLRHVGVRLPWDDILTTIAQSTLPEAYRKWGEPIGRCRGRIHDNTGPPRNITAAERTNAELFYLSRIGKEIEAVPNSEEQAVIARHKRYHELCKLHDPPKIVREKIKIDPETLQSRLIKFTFLVPSSLQTDQTGDSIQKEIPNSFDIYRVKGIVGRLLGVKPMSLRLIWETGEWDPVAGYEDTNSDEEEQTKMERRKSVQTPSEQQRKAGGQLVKREVELEDGTRPVGNCVDGKEVTIRVELRK